MTAFNQAWQANHAYIVPAVVIPTIFAGYTWRCTTPGTSAGTEPTWPLDPSVTPDVTDGTVVWSVGTGFRQAIQQGIASLVQSFVDANPTILRRVYTVRPPNLSESPCFYVADINETITTMNSVRQRIATGFSGYLALAIGAQAESNDRINFIVDALTDLWTLNPHAVSGRSIFTHTATVDTELTDGIGVTYPAVEFQFALTAIQEGRS